MSQSQTLGKTGEERVAEFLQKEGYKIRHMNWVSGKKELDIVAENKDYIVFVEVKTRTEGFLEDLKDVVSKEKQRSIIYAADAYIHRYDISKDSRFDIITVIAKRQTFEIEHIEGAFYPTLR